MIVHADGRCDPHGLSTWAFLVFSRDGERLHEASGIVESNTGSSLLAEWTATLHALRWVREARPSKPVLLRVDAALVAKALEDRSIWVKGEEGVLAEEARRHTLVLRGWGAPVRIERVPRWKNSEADALATLVADALAAEAAAEMPRETPGVPPPSWRDYPHRDAKGRRRARN